MSLLADNRAQARGQFFELAQPDLYRRNAFRVLGLGVGASTRDVRNRQKHLRRREALGIDGNGQQKTILPLDPAPDEDALHDALQRLQDPVTRLLDEFFWFWPAAGEGPDPALELMAQHRNQDALKQWQEREAKEPQNFAVTHNLAVLYHLWALDLEHKSRTQALSEAEQKTRQACWDRSYQRWQKLVRSPDCWQHIRGRIGELDDPRLDRTFAEGVRESLAEVMLLIHARLAVAAAEKGKSAERQQHLETMKRSAFDAELIADALRTALAPARERIRSLVASAEPRAEAEPKQADKVVRELLQEAGPLLKLVDALLPAGDMLRHTAHDEVARAALRASIQYGNSTEDWKVGKALLTEALAQLSPGEAMKHRLEENLEIYSANLRGGMCFFCGERKPEPASNVITNLYGDVEREFTGIDTFRVTWQKLEVKVPRCPSCQTHHENIETATSTWGGGVFLGLTLLLLGGTWLLQSPDATWVYWCTMIVILLVVAGGGAVAAAFIAEQNALGAIPYTMKPESDMSEHPLVVEHVAKGYSFGTEPGEEEQQNAPLKSGGGGSRQALINQLVRALANQGTKPTEQKCPSCGFSYGWDGSECSHCGHWEW